METSAAPIFTDAWPWQQPLLFRLLLQVAAPSFATTQQKHETLWSQGKRLVMDHPFSRMLTTCKKWLSRNQNRHWTFHTWFYLIGHGVDIWNESSPLLQQVRRVNTLGPKHFRRNSKSCCDSCCPPVHWKQSRRATPERQQHGQAKGRQISCQVLGRSRKICWMLEN